MKIVHIITGLNNGGAEGVLFRLCTHDKQNQHIVISMMDGGKYGPLLEKNGVEVYCLSLSQGKISFKGLMNLYKLLKKFNPDVVQTWMYHADLVGGVLARLAGNKNIFWNIRHTELKKGLSKKSTIYIAKISSLASYFIPKMIICCASNAAEVHQNLGYDKRKLTVIHNGFELDRFLPDETLKRLITDELSLGLSSDTIGMVGRYDPQKDHMNLMRAVDIVLKSRPELKVLLVGKDLNNSNNELLSKIKHLDLKDSIYFLDQRSDIPAIMNSLDLHVLSSAYGEGFPNVLAEAMACGIPCVATDVGDSALIVGDTGWIVPVSDSEKLANAILLALKEKENKQQWTLRKQAAHRRISDNFDITTMVEGYNNIWKNN